MQTSLRITAGIALSVALMACGQTTPQSPSQNSKAEPNRILPVVITRPTVNIKNFSELEARAASQGVSIFEASIPAPAVAAPLPMVRSGSTAATSGGIGKQDLTGTKNDIRNYVLPWYGVPIGSTLPPINQSGSTQVQDPNSDPICSLTPYDFQNPSEDLMNVDSNLDTLYPGSFVQGAYLGDGANSLVALPVSPNKRNPIRLAGKGYFQPFWTASSSAGDVHYGIRQALANSQGFMSGDVFVDIRSSNSIDTLATKLSFNAKIMQAIDLKGGFSGTWQTTKKKYMITFVQGIASFIPDMVNSDPSEVISDPIGVFLKSDTTLNDIKTLESFGYMGPSNAPLYVSQVNYGRLMIITVDENERTKQLMATLEASKGNNNVQFEMTLNSIVQDASTKVFARGPFGKLEVADLRAGKWTDFFEAIPADYPALQAMEPIGFKLRDWKGRPVKVSNFLQYNKVTCDPRPSKRVQIQISNIYKNAGVTLKKTGDTAFNTTILNPTSSDSGVIDINGHLGGNNDEIRVSNQGDRPNWVSRWQRKVNLKIWVDGVLKFDKTSECKGCHSTDNAFTVYVNKYTGDVIQR